MTLLLLCAMLCGVASAQDGLSPIAVSPTTQTADPMQPVASASQRLIFTAATATLVGGPDSFELTLYFPGATAEDKLKQALQAASDAVAQTLSAQVIESTVLPPPEAGRSGRGGGWQPNATADKWVALRYTTAPVKIEDLGDIAPQLTKISADAGATKWQAICRRKAPVELTEDVIRAAVTEARRIADLSAKGAGLGLGPLFAIATRPGGAQGCIFQIGPTMLPMPVGGPGSYSLGTRVSVEVACSWEARLP